MLLDISHFKADKYGPNICFLGGVYGNDVCSSIAVSRLISDISSGDIRLIRGEIYVLPVVNHRARDEKKKFCEVDLNRVFRKNGKAVLHEEILAQELMPILDKCDVAIDIQSGYTKDLSLAFQNNTSSDTTKLIRSIPVSNVILGWNKIYGSLKDSSIVDYMYSKESLGTVIKCGDRRDPNSVEMAYKCILSVLNGLSMIGCDDNIYHHFLAEDKIKRSYFSINSFVRKPKEGKFIKDWQHGELLLAGQEIAKDGSGRIYKTDSECFICLPNPEAVDGEEWYYLGNICRDFEKLNIKSNVVMSQIRDCNIASKSN